MKQILLPDSDLSVSCISYGTTGFDGTLPDDRAIALVERYVEAGGNFLDTAHCYSFWMPEGRGASERQVGRVARKLGRERFVIATKGGHSDAGPGYPRPDAFLDPALVSRDLDESLERLDLPQVDLYYLHRDDPRVPAEEIIEASNELVRTGRTRYLGASNWSVARFASANAYAREKGLQPFVVLQNQWSLARPDWTDLTSPGAMRYIEPSEEAALIDSGTVVAAYTAAAGGYFATDGARGRSFDSPAARRQLAAVQAIAEARAVSANQIALAYLLNHPVHVVAIIGTRDEAHLADSLLSADIELMPQEWASLESA